MSTETIPRTGGSAPISPAQHLETSMAAARVSFTWLGVRKTLSAIQKAQAAETFGAEGQYLSATKKLLDTSCPAFKALTSVRNRVLAFWRGMSLPYPEPGLRLIRQDRVELFNEQMTQMRQDLQQAAEELDRQLPHLRKDARDRLGDLFNPADYPSSLAGQFAVEWDFPSVQPPDYLLQLNPELYEQQRRRMVGRFEEAVQLAEDAFTSEFGRLISHLVDRLSASADGRLKTFRDSAVGNLHEFFQQFKQLNVHSSFQLDELVDSAQKMLRGVRPGELRTSQNLRQQIASQLSSVQTSLENLLVDAPVRRIIRSARKDDAA
jgi:hypothetical protein